MTYRVEVTEPAEQDADGIYEFIRDRSPQGASTWWKAFLAALDQIAAGNSAPMRAPEGDAFEEPLFQQLFKTRRGNVYRAIFIIREEIVYILRVRGFGQRLVIPDDLKLPDNE